MGCGKSTANVGQVANPVPSTSTATHDRMSHRLMPYLSIDSPLNINHKYAVFFPIIKDKKVGTGIKQTYAYKSTVSEQELQRKRQEYWDTRVEGSRHMWQALKSACEADETDGMAILSAVGLKLVDKTLQVVYDSQGSKYEVPIFCINPPLAYEIKKETKIDKENIKITNLKVKLRAAGIADIEEQIQSNITVESLKQKFIEKYTQSPLTLGQVRLFYEGKELKNPNLVGEYGVQDDYIITVFVRPGKP